MRGALQAIREVVAELGVASCAPVEAGPGEGSFRLTRDGGQP